MTSVTLSINPEITAKMKAFPEINWSGFMRKAIEQKIETLTWKQEAMKALEEEAEIDAWAVGLQRKARKQEACRASRG